MPKGVILFSSIHYVIQAEKLIKGKGFFYDLIPIPRYLSSDCGTCLLFNWEEKDMILNILKGKGLRIEGIHKLQEKEN